MSNTIPNKNIDIPTYKLLVVVSNRNNINYQNFIDAIKNESIKKKLKCDNIFVTENIVDDNNFKLHFYDVNMSPIVSFDSFDNTTLDKIFKMANQKIGGKKDFKHKYHKYKLKYNRLKDFN